MDIRAGDGPRRSITAGGVCCPDATSQQIDGMLAMAVEGLASVTDGEKASRIFSKTWDQSRLRVRTIERKDINGHYEPSNCYWATDAIQSRNTSRNQMITFQGITLCITDWALRLGLSVAGLRHRLRSWPFENAMMLPPGQSRWTSPTKVTYNLPKRNKINTITNITPSIPDGPHP